MRKSSYAFLLLGLCFFALLAFNCFVKGPETEVLEAEGRRTAPAALAESFSLMPFSSDAPEQQTEERKGGNEDRDQVIGETLKTVIISSDRNGMPLSGPVWRKSVYLVCPPEGVPG